MDRVEIYEKVKDLLVVASEGTITHEDLNAVDGQLEKAGYTSLAYMAFLSGLEQSFGITVDPFEEPDFLSSVETITVYVCEQLGTPLELEGAKAS